MELKKKLKKVLIFFFAAFVALIIYLAAKGYISRLKEVEENQKLRAQKTRAIAVRCISVQKKTIKQLVYATGTIRAVKRHYCYFEAQGRCVYVKQIKEKGKERDIKDGDRVKKGDVLAKLDPRSILQDIKLQKAALREAEIAHQKAQVDTKRQKKLYDKNLISETDLESYKLEEVRTASTVITTKAKLEKAKINYEHTKIIAPANGIVAYMNAKIDYYYTGSYNFSSESDALRSIPFVILEDYELELSCELPASYIHAVKVGQEVIILAPTGNLEQPDSSQKIQAKVYSINPAIDPDGRSVYITIRTKCSLKTLKDGLFVSCWIVVQESKNALTLPHKAILFQDNKPILFCGKK